MKRLVLLSLLATVVAMAGCQKNEGPETTDLSVMEPTTAPPVEPTPPLTPATDVPPPPVAETPTPPTGDIFTPPPPSDIDTTSVAPPAEPRVHVVQPGETLWKIAGKYYGRATRANVAKIAAANPEIADPNKIRAGQKIVIPE